jgi:hypothetical protein
MASPEDYTRAEALIDSRLGELDQREAKGKPDKTGEVPEEGPAGEAGEGQQRGHDPRIRPLQTLLLAVKREAALTAHHREVEEPLAEQTDQLDKIQS